MIMRGWIRHVYWKTAQKTKKLASTAGMHSLLSQRLGKARNAASMAII